MRFAILSALLLATVFAVPQVRAQSVTNTATATLPNTMTCAAPAAGGVCAWSAADTDALVSSQLALVKTASAASFVVGTAASYTLTVTNGGAAATTLAATVTDTVPTGLAIGTLPAGCVLTPAGSQTVVCTIAAGLSNVAGANTRSFVIPVTPTIAAAAPGLTNTATISGGGDAGCPAEARCSSSVSTPVLPTVVANPDTFNVAAVGGTTASVVANDRSNGLQAVIGSNVSLTAGTAPTPGVGSIAMSPDGTIVIAAGTTAGSYPYPYTLCTLPTTAPPTCASTTATVVVGTAQSQALTIALSGNADADGSGSVSYRDVLSYTVTMTNTGNAPLDDVAVSAPSLSPATISCASVAPGATCVLTGTHTVSQADTIAGVITTSATATSPICASGSTAPGCVATLDTPVLALSLSLTNVLSANADGDGSGTVTLGDVLTYTVTATNTSTAGNLANVDVRNDRTVPGTTACASVAPGASCVLVGTHVVQQADIDAGQIVSAGSAQSPICPVFAVGAPQPALDFGQSNCFASLTTPVAQSQSLVSAKTVTTTGPYALGATIGYSIAVTNTGTVTLAGVVVADVMLGTSQTCATVAPGASCTLTGAHVVVQADVDNGQIANVATITTQTPGVCPAGDTSAACNPTVTTPITQVSALTSAKTVTTTGPYALGATIGYSIVGTNSGTVTLTGVVVADVLLGTSQTCPTLAPGASCTLVGNHVVTQADVDSGQIANTATITTQTPGVCAAGNTTPSCNPTITTPIAQAGALTSAKTVTTTGPYAVGATIGYSIAVTNTGTVTLAGVVVTDTMLGTSQTCATLALGASCTLTGTYTVTQADVDNGAVANTATITTQTPGVCPVGDTTLACNPTITTPITQVQSLTSAKTVTTTGPYAAGSTIGYRISVTNTGTVTLSGVVVADTMLGTSQTCATVAPGDSCTLTGNHVVTLADVANGEIANTATITTQTPGVCPAGDTSPACNPTITTPVAATVVANPDTFTVAAAGGTTASVVANDLSNGVQAVIGSNVTLAAGTAPTPTAGSITMAPDGSITVTAGTTAGSYPYPYTICSIPATVPPTCGTATATVVVGAAQSQTLAVVLGSNADGDGSGTVSYRDVLTYIVTMTNTGNAPLDDVIVSAPSLSPATISCASVAPGASCVLTGTHTVSQAETTAGVITTDATATSPICAAGSTDPGCAATLATPVIGLSLSLTHALTGNADGDGSGTVSVGDVLTYTVTATNASSGGNLANVEVRSDTTSPATTTCALLAPGASCVLAGTYVVQQADVDAGQILAAGSAQSPVCPVFAVGTTPPAPAFGESTCYAVVTTPLAQSESLASAKTVTTTGPYAAGSTIGYRISVTNTGTVTLSGVVVADTMLGTSQTCATVAPGDSCTLTGNHVVTLADVANGEIANTATITTQTPGVCPAGDTSPACNPTITTPVAATVVANPDTFTVAAAGGTTASVVANDLSNGVQAVIGSNVTLAAGTAPTPTAGSITMAPDGSITVTAGTTAGSYPYPYTICSIPATVPPTCGTATATVVVGAAQSQTLAVVLGSNADGDGSGTVSYRDVLTYTVTMTNTGNAPLDDVVVASPLLSPASNSCPSVAPGASCALTGTHAVSQVDVTAGVVAMTASATSPICAAGSTDPGCAATLDTPVIGLSLSLATALTANADGDGSGTVSVGDVLTYTVTLTNTSSGGNLANVQVRSDRTAPALATCALVAPGTTCVLVGTYTVQQADVAAGQILAAGSAQAPVCAVFPVGTTPPPPAFGESTCFAQIATPVAATITANADSFVVPATGGTTASVVANDFTNGQAALIGNNVTLAPGTAPTPAVGSITMAPDGTITVTAGTSAGSYPYAYTICTLPATAPPTCGGATASVIVGAAQAQGLTIALTGNADGDGSGTVSYRDVLTFTVTMTNAGNTPLDDVVVSAPALSPATIGCASVAPGASCVLVGTHAVSQADTTAGAVTTTASATSPICSAGSTSAGCAATLSTPVTALSLSLSHTVTANADGDGSGTITVGDVLTYTVTATNTSSNGNLVDVDVRSDRTVPATTTCATLAPGATCILVGSYTVQAADVAAGQIVSAGSAQAPVCPVFAVGTTPPPPAFGESACFAPITTAVAATVVANDDSFNLPAGGGTSASVVANDFSNGLQAVVGSNVTLTPGTAPTPATGSITMAADGSIVVAAGTSAGSYPYAYTICALPATAPPTCGGATATVIVGAAPSQTLTVVLTGNADGDGSGTVSYRDVLTYTVTMTNTGNATLANVEITAPQLAPSSLVCASVAPGATCVLVGTHAVSQADTTAGTVTINATATSPVCAAGSPDPGCTATLATPVTALSLSLFNVATSYADNDGSGTPTVGDVVTFVVTATNTSAAGNLINVEVRNDITTPATNTCALVAPGGTCVLTGTYTIQQADLDAGEFVSGGSAQSAVCPVFAIDATPPPPVFGESNCYSVVFRPIVRALTLVSSKTVTTTGPYALGATIDYLVEAANVGTATLTGVVVTDPMLGVSQTCATLVEGATCSLVGSYVVTQADVDNGQIANTATITTQTPGVCPPGDASPVCHPEVVTPIVQASSLASAKTVTTSGPYALGATIGYSIVVTNTGTVTLTGVTVADPMLGASQTCATLAAGASCTLVGNHVVTQTDVDNGQVANTATVTTQVPGVCPVGDTSLACNPTVTTPLAVSTIMVSKRVDASAPVQRGATLTYTLSVTVADAATTQPLTLTDTLGGGLDFGGVTSAGSFTCSGALVCTLPAGTPVGTHEVSYIATVGAQATGAVSNAVVASNPPGGDPDPECNACTTSTDVALPGMVASKTATLSVDDGTPGVGNVGDVIAYAVSVTNTGNTMLQDLVVLDSLAGAAPTTLACAPTTLVPGAVAVCEGYTHTIIAADVGDGGQLRNDVTATASAQMGSATVTVTAEASATLAVEADQARVRLVKRAMPANVVVGDLVRYTVIAENTGLIDVVDGTLVDTPPAGFHYVADSLVVEDRDGVGRLAGSHPIRIDQLDIAAGETASISYLLRVGAGVRAGIHTNSAYVLDNGNVVSNLATADVQMVGDPMLDESLILGTVFDDRDGDGWQDSASLGEVHLRGGFAASAYVAHSTTLDRGQGPVPVPDASAPMLHGLSIGTIAGRQSDADPAGARRIVVSQQLRTLAFTDDFVLTAAEGIRVHMDAAGHTRIARDGGEAGKGLGSAEPIVERRVSQLADGYRVDYVIANAGVEERGIPGVRIASVEGLLIETDQFGRYHLAGVTPGGAGRGSNFVLKVDPSTLPPGSTMTTANPLLRRVTPGLPVRFDFGVKLPPGLVEGGRREVEIELGQVVFAEGSAEVRHPYLPLVDRVVDNLRAHGGGEVVISANGESPELAYDRAKAVQARLLAALTPEQAGMLTISLRSDLADADSTLLSLAPTPLLGAVLFDTDRAEIRPEFKAVIARIAADIEAMGGGVVGIVGHADRRGALAYNDALGLQRAKAIHAAIAAQLSPEARSRLRVDIDASPTAPVGIRER
ncbi:DUF7507 domain-containing protein [Luteimonas sp. RIT-PG2_3]